MSIYDDVLRELVAAVGAALFVGNLNTLVRRRSGSKVTATHGGDTLPRRRLRGRSSTWSSDSSSWSPASPQSRPSRPVGDHDLTASAAVAAIVSTGSVRVDRDHVVAELEGRELRVRGADAGEMAVPVGEPLREYLARNDEHDEPGAGTPRASRRR